jgi:hypothetical protein
MAVKQKTGGKNGSSGKVFAGGSPMHATALLAPFARKPLKGQSIHGKESRR